MARVRRTALAAAAATALVVSGCGGHAATRADVIARGNAACASALRTLRALAPPENGTTAALSQYLERALPVVRTEVAALAALPRPKPDRATLMQFVAAERRLAADYAMLAAQAKAGDSAGVTAALQALQENPAAALAARYGLSQCAGSTATIR